ncbi:unnamed protein product [Owenia fusiformis]|uniref:Uncharacterized protein n=1 Tax=Owenia fusiformis TaxID=6347 RepID=A0A8J1UYY3_OWEFU|nr:unnamed protein product [Owenia fusiformis]
MTAVYPQSVVEAPNYSVDAEPTHAEVIDEHSSDSSKLNVKRPLRRGSTWQRVRDKWNRKGIQEIGHQHKLYDLTECMKKGIKEAVTGGHGPKAELVADDYKHILTETIKLPSGKVFHFESYASSVFATLRSAIGLSEEDFLQSMAPMATYMPYYQFISNSKSGQDFFLTYDKVYFIKTEKKHYIEFFLNILGDYLQHFQRYPHSLLVKFLGLYSVHMEGKAKRYFFVMPSIFYPEERIQTRYDLKGCYVNRYEKPPAKDSHVIAVLKDQNFRDAHDVIELSSQRDWFIEQIRVDSTFLRDLGAIDYSLLVGKHSLQSDEKNVHFDDVITRVKRSVVGGAPSSRGSSGGSANGTLEENTTITIDNQAQSTDNSTPLPQRSFSLVDTRYLDGTSAQNRRLLPDCKNALHIIDGPNHRYFIGIIDFFKTFECKQQMEQVLKTVIHCGTGHSTCKCDKYSERFIRWVDEQTK